MIMNFSKILSCHSLIHCCMIVIYIQIMALIEHLFVKIIFNYINVFSSRKCKKKKRKSEQYRCLVTIGHILI